MSEEWAPTSPVILTDAVFFSYVPTPLYSGTALQRQAAYLAAEQAVVREIGSPLLPTQVSGTWMWPMADRIIETKYRRIQSVDEVTVLYGGGTGTCPLVD